MRRTSRGFAVYSEIKDSKGNTVRVQESSLAGGPYCWVFCNAPDGSDAHVHMGRPLAYSPHLTRIQARRLAAALLKFAHGESE